MSNRKERALTLRQQLFVEQYLILGNGREAAIRAGYSPQSAATLAVNLKHLPHVAEAIRRGRADSARSAAIDRDRVLEELARTAFSDMGRIAEWGPEGIVLKSNAEIAPEDRAAISELAVAPGAGAARIRLHNKQRALDSIARQPGFYGRGSRVGGYPGHGSPSERLALAESARAKLKRMIEALAEKAEDPGGTALT
jgi:phage terminase small subunit